MSRRNRNQHWRQRQQALSPLREWPELILPSESDEERCANPLCFMKMTQGTYAQVIAALGSRPPEAAGIFLGPRHDEPLATHFVLDEGGCGTSVSFSLGAEFLNEVLARFRPCGLTCIGIGHSHPFGIETPSHGDLVYLASLFGREANQDIQSFLFPVFCGGRLHPYMVRPGRDLPTVQPAALVLV